MAWPFADEMWSENISTLSNKLYVNVSLTLDVLTQGHSADDKCVRQSFRNGMTAITPIPLPPFQSAH
ncbi:hypothetical protein EMIT0P74_50240 [Pseudomonas sp. IT-P74]